MNPCLRMQLQRTEMDCAVACLAMYLGVSYEEALLASPKRALRSGLEIRHVKGAASRLGHRLDLKRSFDLENDTGLLGVRSKKWKFEHLVVLWDGKVIDTDATIWDVEDFLKAYKAKPLALLVRA